MAIVAANLENIYASLDQYLADHLLFSDGSPVALRLHGVRRFIPPVDLPWIEAHYDFLGLQNRFANRVSRTSAGLAVLAREPSGYLQLNCYQRARSFATRYLLASTRDLIVGAFPEGELIEIRGYESTNTPATMEIEGHIVIDGIQEHHIDTGINSGVVQYVVQIKTRYLELYTRSV